MAETVHRHVIVRGRVQGVGYRAWTLSEAGYRGISGWVRNIGEDMVETVFSGGDPAVRAMIEACRQGPDGADVEAIEEREASVEEIALGRGRGFSVLPSR